MFDALGETYHYNKIGLIFWYVFRFSINFMKSDVSGRKIRDLSIWITLMHSLEWSDDQIQILGQMKSLGMVQLIWNINKYWSKSFLGNTW